MRHFRWRRHGATKLIGGITAGAVVTLAGCQQYERQPLDLAGHESALQDRSVSVGRLQEFMDRLRDLGAEAPETFSFNDGLSPAEGEVLALFYNADLRAARLEAGVALASLENAGLWSDPEFGFDGAEILSPSGSPFEYGLTLSFTIPISGRLEVEKAKAGAAYEAELRRLVDLEWTTRMQVRKTWAAWMVAEQRLELLRDAITQIERITEITDRLEEAGELSRVQSRLFRVELADRRAAVTDAVFATTRLRIELLGLLGLTPDAAVELNQELPATAALVVDDDVQHLIRNNTQLAYRRAQYLVAEESLRLEIRKQYPDITIGPGYGSEDDDRLLLGLSIPVPIFNANRAEIAEAGARRDVVRAAVETTFERLARELAVVRASLEATQSQRSQFESGIVPMLEAQSEEIEQIVALGEVDTLILLETVQRQVNAKFRLLDLQRAEADALAALSRLLGPTTSSQPAPVAGDMANDSTKGENSSTVARDQQ